MDTRSTHTGIYSKGESKMADQQSKNVEIPLNGRLITSRDPTQLGEGDYRRLDFGGDPNLRAMDLTSTPGLGRHFCL